MSLSSDPSTFKALDADLGGIVEFFDRYVQRIKLIFELAFQKADGTSYEPSDKEKKAMLPFRGGDDIKDLFEHVLINSMPRLRKFAQVYKVAQTIWCKETCSLRTIRRELSFERWLKEISNAAKLINYENYDWTQAAVDAILLQTSKSKLRERALQDNFSMKTCLIRQNTRTVRKGSTLEGHSNVEDEGKRSDGPDEK